MPWPRQPGHTAEQTADEGVGEISTLQMLQQLSGSPTSTNLSTWNAVREKKKDNVVRKEEVIKRCRESMQKRERDTDGQREGVDTYKKKQIEIARAGLYLIKSDKEKK